MYMYVLRQTRSTTISIPYYDDQFPAERWREVILEMTNVIVSHVRGCIKQNEVLRSATCLRVRSNANYRFHRPEMSNESISATWRIQRNLLLLMVKLLFQLSLVWKWSKDGNDLWRKWQREMYNNGQSWIYAKGRGEKGKAGRGIDRDKTEVVALPARGIYLNTVHDVIRHSTDSVLSA